MTLLDPKIRKDAMLRGYTDSILVMTSAKFGEIDEEELKNKLSKIQEEERMHNIISKIVDSATLEEFMKYI